MLGPSTVGLLLVLLATTAEAAEYTSTVTSRCSKTDTTAGIQAPAGGSPIPDPDAATFTTVDLCQKHCTDNGHLKELGCALAPTCNVPCQFAVFDPNAATTGPMCILYPAGVNTGSLTAGKTLITVQPAGTACPGAATTVAGQTTVAGTATAGQTTAAAATAGATTVASAAATTAAAAATTAAASSATTATSGDSNPQCCEWAKKGECDVNPFFMKINCKISCGTPTATVATANTVPSNPSAACKPTAGATACKDESTDCTKWALNKQCDENPYYMLVKCASACRKCEGGKPKTLKNACGDTDVPPIAGCTNSKDDCNFWASIGECTRNAAWMPTGCCAACRNIATIYQTCPLAKKAPFTGEG